MSRHTDPQPSSDPLVILTRHRVIRMEGEATQDHQVHLARAAGETGQMMVPWALLRDAWRYVIILTRNRAFVIRRGRHREMRGVAPVVADVAGQVLHTAVER